MPENIIEIIAVLVFFTGFYGLITSKNIIKSIASTLLLEMAVVVFYLNIGYAGNTAPPIGENLNALTTADPLPQALVFTAIITGVIVTAVNVTMLLSLCRKDKTTDWDAVSKKVL